MVDRWCIFAIDPAPNGQKIDTRVSGVPRIFECQIASYDRPASGESLSLRSVQIRAHDCVRIRSGLLARWPVMHRSASTKLRPDGQFTLPLDDSIAKVRPTGRDIALAGRSLFYRFDGTEEGCSYLDDFSLYGSAQYSPSSPAAASVRQRE